MMWHMDWGRLGRALSDAREARKLTQEQVAARLDVSRTIIQSIERGDARKKITPTMRDYAQLVGWTRDSPARVLGGGEPTLAEEPEAAQAAQATFDDLAAGDLAASGLPLRIVAELTSGGPLLDTQVFQLPTESGARMTVVVRGEPDASPEEIKAALEAWRRTEQRLKDLTDDEA